MFDKERDTAIAAVRVAARVCQSVQHGITPDALEKRDRSPVTVADFASQAVICRALNAVFPDDPIIGEEDASALTGPEGAGFLDRVQHELAQQEIAASPEDVRTWIDQGSASDFTRRFWTLDPIDGTKGFLRGEQYAISLALIVDGSIEVAVLGCPNLPLEPDGEQLGTLLFAVRGLGSFAAPLEGSAAPKRIAVSATKNPSEARFCESVESGHTSHGQAARVAERLGITREPLRMDSQAKYAVVARGEAQIYLRLPTKPGYREKIWDHAGGVLVVEEAGGKVTDIDGQPLDFRHGRELIQNRGVIVTNGPLHQMVLNAIQATA